MTVIDRPSPNFGDRRDGRRPDLLVLHYTGMESGQAALERLCDPAAQVSAHYLIEEDGACFRLVAEENRAWHAGLSLWAGESDLNSASIGIELVNPGHEHGYRPFPDAQIAALLTLAASIRQRHGILPHRVVGHSDIAPTRKEDPGELFPWQRLARHRLGLWPKPQPAGAPGTALEAAFLLAQIGYDISDLPATLTAFQRRYRPACLDGRLDKETAALINGLARLLPKPTALAEG
ncbi:N-acetylmuramoyl-L-alanine amidase [Oceanibaculum pacificum]|uniref:N-acetylmuramoyl-L-alanine amidase n=1 Tax=Oceanibaculum pacificum TaxID=580166 RepID=A0A154W429_9PROT|nr:N-acetylmuramoyl-L-alanine amidase [Oceanibaculum pacificum]KZD08308.1 N-acetylmuramoyl-L-alanine amidase [Oceanibaculum pacificum]